MKYSDQLRLPQWQKRRLERLQLAGWACERCATTTEMLQVHHREYIYGNSPWEYSDDQLEVLCECCHEQEHGIGQRAARKITSVRGPLDRIVWLIAHRPVWWRLMADEDKEMLCSKPGWYGELFRYFVSADGPYVYWGVNPPPAYEKAVDMLEEMLKSQDPAVEPLYDDLERSLSMVRENRVLARI